MDKPRAPLLIEKEWPVQLSIGRLGATSDVRGGLPAAQGAQIDLIERRLLRIEMALRRAGIEVELVEMPQ